MKRAQIIRLAILVLIIVVSVFLLTQQDASIYIQGIGLLMACLTGLWLLSLAIKDAGIIDIFWGLGYVIIAWFYANVLGFDKMESRNWVLLALITTWGLRLGIYLAIRNLGKPEDYRYAQWRKDNGKKWWWLSFIRVFALQGFLLWIISSVYLQALSISGELQLLDYVGIVLWVIGFFFEAVGDWQLMQFKKNPDNKGKVLDTGVWRYTRHPNYFGDAMMWWGYFFFALAHPMGWIFVFCPVIMNFFLVKVSGVAMLEQNLKKTKPKYLDYINRTSAFIPMLPKTS